MTEKALTDVDGIGTKTAKALKAAGIADVAALAAIDLANPPALQGFKGTPAWTDWVAAAKKLGAEASPPEPATEPAAEPAPEQEPAPPSEPEPATKPEAPPTPESASVIASAEAAPEQQREGPGQPHPAGSGPIGEDPYDGPVLVVTGPKRGFRRAGFQFGKEPTTLTPADFGEGIDAARRFVAIYREPRLNVTLRAPDGSLIEFNEGDISALEIAIADPDTDESRAILEQFGHLTAAE